MKKAIVVVAVLLMAASAQAGTITINFCDATNADSLVAGVYNYNMAGTHGWVGTAPVGAGTIDFAFGDWEPVGFLVGSAPEGWYGGSWEPIKNTFGYAGDYSYNGIAVSVTDIPAAWGTVAMDVWWGGYGPTGNWRGLAISNGGGSTISTGNIDNGGAFGAISFTGDQIPVAAPEPATMSLLVLGGVATLIRRRNRRA